MQWPFYFIGRSSLITLLCIQLRIYKRRSVLTIDAPSSMSVQNCCERVDGKENARFCRLELCPLRKFWSFTWAGHPHFQEGDEMAAKSLQ